MRKFLPMAVGGGAGFLVAALLFSPATFRSAGLYFASLVFPERVTPEALIAKYVAWKPVRVLIVPGHDDESWGTDYRGLREADATVELGGYLKSLFAADPRFAVFITRDEHGYTPEIVTYLTEQSSLIREFRDYVRTVFTNAVRRGEVAPKTENYHGTATDDVARKLYGFNKWANDHEIDIVFHLHFNDYPRRRRNLLGRYTGWSIYVPESQLPNARVSRAVAEAVASELRTQGPASDYPQEQAGVVEEQELIAIGSYASLHPASLVIEYGYFYEPRFTDAAGRPAVLWELARLTYQGVGEFLTSGGGVEEGIKRKYYMR